MRFPISLISADNARGKTQRRMDLGAIIYSHGVVCIDSSGCGPSTAGNLASNYTLIHKPKH